MVKAKGEAKVTDMVVYGMWDGEEEEEERRKQKKREGELEKKFVVFNPVQLACKGLVRCFCRSVWVLLQLPAQIVCCATVRDFDSFLLFLFFLMNLLPPLFHFARTHSLALPPLLTQTSSLDHVPSNKRR